MSIVGASNGDDDDVVFWLLMGVGLGNGCLVEEGLERLNEKTPRAPLERSLSLSFVDSASRSEPDPFLLGLAGVNPSLDADSLEGNRGANDVLREWTGGGSSGAGVKNASEVGEDTEIEMPGSGETSPRSGGEDERGLLVGRDGNMCFTGLPGPELAEVGCKVALLLLLFLYSCTLF